MHCAVLGKLEHYDDGAKFFCTEVFEAVAKLSASSLESQWVRSRERRRP
jgi:hypothetical protein